MFGFCRWITLSLIAVLATVESGNAVDNCDASLCSNNGACFINEDEHYCQCSEPYFGVDCELDRRWGPDAYNASNGYSYKVIAKERSYEDSKWLCQEMEGQLAYLGMRNEDVYKEILAHFDGSKHQFTFAYIDLTSTGKNDGFRWGDKVPASLEWTNWSDGEASNSSGKDNCVNILKGIGSNTDKNSGWINVNCASKAATLCEQLTNK